MDPMDTPITFTIEKEHIIEVDDTKVRVEIGLTLRELLGLLGIRTDKRRRRK